MENTCSHEFAWSSHRLEVQLLLLLLHQLTLHFGLFLLLHSFLNVPWKCPMMFRYASLFALLFIELIMLMEMQVACRVSSEKKGPALTLQFDKVFVTSEY